MKHFLLSLFLLMAAGVHAQGLETISFDGKNRTLITHVPSNLPENAPLVITLHGANQSADYQQEHTKWNTVADTAKFVVVYPNAINAFWDTSGQSDVRFISHIMDLMYERHKIDRNRIYLSGFSLGAMMCYHCIEHLGNKVAAFGPVSGVRFDNRAPTAPRIVPIIHTHCKGDDVFKWEGDPGHMAGGYPYIPDYVKSWALYEGMDPTPEFIDPYPSSKPNSDADMTIYRRPDSVVEVRLLSFDGAGHWHVDADGWGGVSTTQEIWNFCKRYTLDLNDVEPPVLLKAEPEDGSFDLPDSQREFTLTLDRAAWKTEMSAKLTGNGKTIDLRQKEPENPDGLKTATPTFLIPEDAAIEPGEYTLTLDGVCTSTDFTRSYSFEYTYGVEEVGDQLNVQPVLVQDWHDMTDRYGECIPEGWQRVLTKSDGTTETADFTDGVVNGPRLVHVWPYGDITGGLYLTARDVESCNLNYGRIAGQELNLPVGKYALSFYSAYWDKTSQRRKATFGLDIKSRSNRGGFKIPVQAAELPSTGIANETSGPVFDTQFHEFLFKVDKKDKYIINFDIAQGNAGVVIGTFQLTTAPTNADRYKGGFLRLYALAQGAYAAAVADGEANAEELAALKAALDKYEVFSSTAPSAYIAAIAELEAAYAPFRQLPCGGPCPVESIGQSHALPVSTTYYTADGRQINAPGASGITIVRTVYSDGKTIVRKSTRRE